MDAYTIPKWNRESERESGKKSKEYYSNWEILKFIIVVVSTNAGWLMLERDAKMLMQKMHCHFSTQRCCGWIARRLSMHKKYAPYSMWCVPYTQNHNIITFQAHHFNMVIINLRFVHENSIFPLNNFILVAHCK